MPHKAVVCDNRIYYGLILKANLLYLKKATIMNNTIKSTIMIFLLKRQLHFLQDWLIDLIEASKQKYYSG